MKLSRAIKKYNRKDFFFIEIGAYDGKKFDPIKKYIEKYKWRGIMVEPIWRAFKKLRKRYKGSDIILENVAIARRNGRRKMYMVDTERDLPENFRSYAKTMSSFYKDMWLRKKRSPEMAKMFKEDVLPYMKEVIVDCLTLSSLMKKHDVKKVDLLQIDVEGYDYEILKTIKIKPPIVQYENMNLGKDKEECFKFMQDMGYEVEDTRSNTVCVL